MAHRLKSPNNEVQKSKKRYYRLNATDVRLDLTKRCCTILYRYQGVAILERKLNKNITFPLSHQLIEILRDLILKNNYQAGQPFFTEKELAEKYGLSRTTLREATSRLVYEGLLKIEQIKKNLSFKYY